MAIPREASPRPETAYELKEVHTLNLLAKGTGGKLRDRASELCMQRQTKTPIIVDIHDLRVHPHVKLRASVSSCAEEGPTTSGPRYRT